MNSGERWLKISFLAGAIVDAVAFIMILVQSVKEPAWGLGISYSAYIFSMRYGASLMMGWTILLVWSCRKPLERRFMAPLTSLVVVGIMVPEIYAAVNHAVDILSMTPILGFQVFLLGLFGFSYLASRNSK